MQGLLNQFEIDSIRTRITILIHHLWEDQSTFLSNMVPPIVIRTPQYTIPERIFLLEQKLTKVPHKVIKDSYKRKFPFSGRSPNKMQVWKTVKKFEDHGTVHNMNKGNSGRRKSVLTIPTSRRDISLLGGRTGYVPPMKEASVMWRRGDEGGEGMSISNYGAISDCGWAGN